MGDAAGQDTEGFQISGLDALGFHLLAGGDVLQHPDQSFLGMTGIKPLPHQVDPAQFPVFPLHLSLEVIHLVPGQRRISLIPGFEISFPVEGQEFGGLAQQLVVCIAENSGHGGVGPDDYPVFHEQHTHPNVVEDDFLFVDDLLKPGIHLVKSLGQGSEFIASALGNAVVEIARGNPGHSGAEPA